MNLSIKEELGVDLVMLVAGGPGVLYELAVGKPLDQILSCVGGSCLIVMICCWYGFVLNTDLLSPF